ncbi:MAG: tetratricopeptide repeat protein, partial [Spirochaetaceae bacterium]|nr:tetratricopeptide repeat protein [Spirochaetaceae bacterium]
GDYRGAENSFTRALEAAPDDGQTNYNMAVVKIALDKKGEALGYARKAFDAAPSNAVFAYTLGLAFEETGDNNGAITSYTRAASLDRSYLRPRVNLGRLYLENGFPDQALAFLNEAYGVDASAFEVNNNLGAVYAHKEDWERSVLHYEKALSTEPGNATVRVNLARTYVGAGNLGAARDAYLAALRTDNDNWDAIMELGKTCASLQDGEQAKRYLQDLLNRNPGYPRREEAERILGGL